MKAHMKWRNFAKQAFVLLAGACFLAGLVGCNDDDNDDPVSLEAGTWELSATASGYPTMTETIELPGEGGVVPEGTFSYGGMTFTVSGNSIDLDIELDDGTTFRLDGKIGSGTSMSGTFSYYDPGPPEERFSGNWSARKID
ncbi:hypothetical protein PDESU_05736 [Pontiella desulfatans]|uniref:Lipocalin-like domain-containing protein n=1 Tax=Pontiella desulfatans TaxID=2750659 RepID=A0A6C2UCJ3_PONDE|nr:hypothetical protein [Pontiella desulfatans]VGO17141.1 hypothetical protein PDESU_05736 [Pontiella desulfatans]